MPGPGKKFTKGNKAAVGSGRPKKPKDLKQAEKALSNTILEAKIRKYLALTKDEIKQVTNDPKTPAIDLALCSIIAKAITGSDQQRLDWVITRLLGKVKDVREIQLPKPTVVERLDDGSKMLLGAEIVEGEEIED